MPAPFDLDRFVLAQDPVLDQVRHELRAGAKRSHWMWFVFPQIAGLGHSEMAQRYAIASLEEAGAYLRHSVLGPRLVACTDLANQADSRSAYAIFGTPDDLKFRSCMTLFAQVPGAAPVFAEAVARYFAGAPDPATLGLLAGKSPPA